MSPSPHASPSMLTPSPGANRVSHTALIGDIEFGSESAANPPRREVTSHSLTPIRAASLFVAVVTLLTGDCV
jgi:hypothetical protein